MLHHVKGSFFFSDPQIVGIYSNVFIQGNVRFQLMREDMPITKRLRMSFMLNTDKEYMAGFRYIVNKNVGITSHYDSDMGFGAGITFSY